MQKQINWIDKEAAARIASLLASANLSNEQAKQAIQNTLESSARTNGIKINNKILNSASQDIIDKYKYDSNQSYWDVEKKVNNIGPDNPWQAGYYLYDKIKSLFSR